VDLVQHLSQDYMDERGKAETDTSGRLLLWSGLSWRLQARVCEALDAKKIAHVESSRELGMLPSTKQTVLFIWVAPQDHNDARTILDRLIADPKMEDVITDEADAEGRRRPFTRYRRSVDGWGPTSQQAQGPLDGALGSVNRIFGGVQGVQPADFDGSPFENTLSIFNPANDKDDDEPAPDDLIEDFHPDDATAEVWAGEDAGMAENLSNCLRNVGVGCVQREDRGKCRLLVLPMQEKRAREVVQQVLDAS
jgi:hypothetical protein